MVERNVWIDEIGMEQRRVVVENGRPVEYTCIYGKETSLVGNLYLGKIVNILKAMNAAFVDIGMKRHAFLSMDDLPGILRDTDGAAIAKPQPVKQGQDVLVQVTKEPGGEKGPRVTMNPTFPGSLAVLLPTIQTVGISRHIQSSARREALLSLGKESCPEGMGLILRTASEAATDADILAEISDLHAQWQRLAQLARVERPPKCLLDSGDLCAQTVRDLGTEPVLSPIPDDIETRLAKDLRRKVWLNSGGYLVIDHTEALTVIDVNSGKFTGKKNHAETLVKLNSEAAEEAARQIRLRDLGGIILIDFVDMDSDADRETVETVFRDTLTRDRAKHHLHGYTGTGLMELTRRPLVKPLKELTKVSCGVCGGEGAVATAMAEAHTTLRDIRRKRAAGEQGVLTYTVPKQTFDVLRQIGLPDSVEIILETKGDTP